MADNDDNIPEVILSRKACYRAGYMIINSFCFWSTILYARQPLPNFIVLLLSYFVVTMSFFVVQASNPGYLDESILIADEEMSIDQLKNKNIDEETKENEDDQLCPNNLLFCRRCDILVPLRSHHCRECNRCVSTFDHHCPVIGTCIGERNQCRFWWFLFLHFGVLWVFMDLIRSDLSDPKTLRDIRDLLYWLEGILWFYLLLILGTQTWFAMSATTTYECSKSRYKIPYLKDFDDFDLPFTKGLCPNLYNFCCLRDTLLSDLLLRRDERSSCVHSSSSSSNCSRTGVPLPWRPLLWPVPAPVVRDSENICDNLWQNKYYSCC